MLERLRGDWVSGGGGYVGCSSADVVSHTDRQMTGGKGGYQEPGFSYYYRACFIPDDCY